MPIKTGWGSENARVSIDYSQCTVCGLCVRVCKGNPLYLENDKVCIDQSRLFGCIGCGQCAAVCPVECIQVEGRNLASPDLVALPAPEDRADYDQLMALMMARRSIRDFKKEEVEQEKIEKIIRAASTAPMGIPPSDVEVLVLNSQDKVKEFAGDIITAVRKSKWIFSRPLLLVLRPFMKKSTLDSINTFINPAINVFLEKWDTGTDWLLYEAPLAMYFHTSPYADPADPLITATYAMLAAETLGLGSCMIGTVGYYIKYSKSIKQKYNIPLDNQQGIMVIFGYPAVKYKKSITRRLARVHYF